MRKGSGMIEALGALALVAVVVVIFIIPLFKTGEVSKEPLETCSSAPGIFGIEGGCYIIGSEEFKGAEAHAEKAGKELRNFGRLGCGKEGETQKFCFIEVDLDPTDEEEDEGATA